ncbi:hypothetical protein DN585_06350 [Intrasporangium calvum]|nr:hypothetical protein DN585_06350 [Intrasporangium calvum]
MDLTPVGRSGQRAVHLRGEEDRMGHPVGPGQEPAHLCGDLGGVATSPAQLPQHDASPVPHRHRPRLRQCLLLQVGDTVPSTEDAVSRGGGEQGPVRLDVEVDRRHESVLPTRAPEPDGQHGTRRQVRDPLCEPLLVGRPRLLERAPVITANLHLPSPRTAHPLGPSFGPRLEAFTGHRHRHRVLQTTPDHAGQPRRGSGEPMSVATGRMRGPRGGARDTGEN